MSYINQEMKKHIAPGVKEVLKEYNMSGTLSIRGSKSLILTLKSGPLDFQCGGQISKYWLGDKFCDKEYAFLTKMFDALNNGNWDKSEAQFDYFDVGWYTYIKVSPEYKKN